MKRNPITLIRSSKSVKMIAAFLLVNLITQLGFPTISFALTSGPGQEEFSSFEPASTSDMVDVYSGDFTYNIPLLTVPGPNGGYPINLAYHSGVTMEQEASWVGLGWSLNVGSINRQIRGLPDDYNGSLGYNVTHKMKYNTSWNVNLDLPIPPTLEENFGVSPPSLLGASLYYNNFKGLGYRVFKDFIYPSNQDCAGAGIGVGLSYDSQNGIGIEPDLSIHGAQTSSGVAATISASYNSKAGLQDFNFSSSLKLGTGAQQSVSQNQSAIVGLNSSSSISFGTGQPPGNITMPMTANSYTFHIAIGPVPYWPSFVSTFPLLWSGSFDISNVANGGVINQNGYGYMYTPQVGSSTGSSNIIQDFHRDDLPYSDNIPNLAPSSMTYDIYTQTGQGTGHVFRPYLSSAGVISDPTIQSTSNDYDITFELGVSIGAYIGAHVKAGLNCSFNTSSSGSWQWESDDDVDATLSALNFNSPSSTASNWPDYEPCYFQVYGEKSVIPLQNDNFTSVWGGDRAVRVALYEQNPSWFNTHFKAKGEFVNSLLPIDHVNSPGAYPINARGIMNARFDSVRQIRGTNIESFTNAQAGTYGYSRFVTIDDLTTSNPNESKNFLTTPQDGISEMSVLQDDGMRYVYGLPQYNNSQMDATFSVGSAYNAIKTKAIVPGSGTNIDPSSTYQGYLSETDLTQPYANSWLLTEIVSDDYVDVTGNGPSDDDYGYWVKFNYKKTSGAYQWRNPYKYANFIDGMKNYDNDDKATFTYGTKELYYLESIETKTNIAVFITSPRQDGVGANDEITGGRGSGSANTMYELDQIKLYAKTPAYFANPSAAIPIKVINFRYSYDLCPGVDNNTQLPAYASNDVGHTHNINTNYGKLTLDTLFFTYQNSSRGEASPYIFNYSVNNVGYNQNNYDRWGSYKNNDQYASYSPNYYPYPDLPYTDQYYYRSGGNLNPALDAGEWSLTAITLPTGGTINVNYEQKDYAYIENNRAQAMFDIVAEGPSPTLSSNTVTQDRETDGSPITLESQGVQFSQGARSYQLWFRLETPQPSWASASPGDSIFKYYLNNGSISTVYYKVYCDLKGASTPASTNSKADYVSGYAPIFNDASDCGMDASGNYGFITLQPVPMNSVLNYTGDWINPITRACIEYLRADRSEILYDFTSSEGRSFLEQVGNFFVSIASFFVQLMTCIVGYNAWAYLTGYGQHIYCNGKSVVRLMEPSGKKIGGGSRVAELDLHDNWVDAGSADYYYGQTYNYTTTDQNGATISSGVAYEPEVGNEESALATPVSYSLSNLFSSTYHLYVENPIMKSYYPGASVGYSKVTVTSVGKSRAIAESPLPVSSANTNILDHSAAPVSVYEFYTAKDFPVIQDQTDLTSDAPIVRPFLIPGIYSTFKKRKARSQGYSVVLNDMAGKMKRLTVMTQPVNSSPGNIISEQDYNYQTVLPYDPNNTNELCNTVQVLNTDGKFQSALMGQTSEAFVDMNENCQQSNSYGLTLDVDAGVVIGVPPIPLIYIMPFPFLADNNLSMRTVVTNKVIYRTGILENVITTTDGSKVSQSNIAYDPQTGEPLLTSVTNEFDAPIYKYSYPAYWYYTGMGGAYHNFGLTLTGLIIGGAGQVDISADIPAGATASTYYIAGDQVYVTGTNTGLYTVASVNGTTITLIDDNLTPPAGNYIPFGSITSMETVKSGYANLQSSKAGTLVTESLSGIPTYSPGGSPLSNGPSTFSNYYNSVLDAKAVQFSDAWNTLCGTNIPGTTEEEGGGNCALAGQSVNPWMTGIQGIWRPAASWVYEDSRYQAGVGHINTDGVYLSSHNNTFVPFPWVTGNIVGTDWVVSNIITQYSPFGYELENQNAVGVYSAALYGYNNSLVTAVAHNARYHQIAFDGFEDYSASLACNDNNFRFTGDGTDAAGTIVNTQAHTGNYSMQLLPNQVMAATKAIFPGADSLCPVSESSDSPTSPVVTTSGVGVASVSVTIGSSTSIATVFPGITAGLSTLGTGPTGPIISSSSGTTGTTPGLQPGAVGGACDICYTPYTFSPCNCIGEFWPSVGQQYAISAWVKEIPSGSNPFINSLINYPSPQIQVVFYNGSSPIQITNYIGSGNIIEDWQRVYGVYTVPAGATSITVFLRNLSTTSTVYFDDFRSFPFASNMTTYVYDNINTFRVMAELDPNNYATIYNYDDEGHLTSVKKETTNGLATIKEGRINNSEQ